MRAPPTEPLSFSTETDDEDLEEGSGEDIIIISGLKGGLLSHTTSFPLICLCMFHLFVLLCHRRADPIRRSFSGQKRESVSVTDSSFTLSLVMITAACVFSGHYHAEGRERRARAPGLSRPPRSTYTRRTRAPGPAGTAWRTRTRQPACE